VTKINRYLSAEGILSENVITSGSSDALEDCIFSIHLQRLYTAARELREFKVTSKDTSEEDERTQKYRNALEVSKSLYSTSTGSPTMNIFLMNTTTKNYETFP
jgi:hypothetical protein